MDDAVDGPWLAWNTADYTNAITIDVDHDRWLDLTESAIAFYGCPRPLIVYDQLKLTAHLTWFLKTPVRTTQDARPKPVGWLQRIRVGLTAIFEGDGSYTNRLTKNPFSPAWDTLLGGDPVEMSDLWRTVTTWCDDHDRPAPKSAFIRPIIASTEILKGKRVFDVLRYRCYAAGECDRNTIEEWAFEIASDLGSPTSSKNVSKIARSVARFMSTRWTGRRSPRGNRGAMMLATTKLTLTQKQAMSGKRSAVLVVRKTDYAIHAAYDRLAERGEKVTQEQVAQESGMSVRTVRRVWPDLKTGKALSPSGSEAFGRVEEAKPTIFSENLISFRSSQVTPSIKPIRPKFMRSITAKAITVDNICAAPRSDNLIRTTLKNLEIVTRLNPIEWAEDDEPMIEPTPWVCNSIANDLRIQAARSESNSAQEEATITRERWSAHRAGYTPAKIQETLKLLAIFTARNKESDSSIFTDGNDMPVDEDCPPCLQEMPPVYLSISYLPEVKKAVREAQASLEMLRERWRVWRNRK